jgi:hypothetical protein
VVAKRHRREKSWWLHVHHPGFLPTVEMTDQRLFEYSGSKDGVLID